MNFLKITSIYILIILSSFLLFTPLGVVAYFGDIEFASIIFHIFMPTKDQSYDWVYDLKLYFLFSIAFSIFLVFLYSRFQSKKYFLGVILSICLFDMYYINKHFSIWQYIVNSFTFSNFIEQNYVFPQKVDIVFPQRKRNLILISVESLETSFQDKKNGGFFNHNYIPELTNLAKKNISFSASNLIEGGIVLPETGWTMAALVAQTAGIPLKLYKIHTANDQIGNRLNQCKSFLSKTITLGDILKSYGYQNYFILGTSQNFAGQGIYLKQHGNFTIYDYFDIKKHLNVEKPNEQWWGLLDKDVYQFSREKLVELSLKNEPFSVIIQTIDSHRDGILSNNCSATYDKLIENVYSCVSSQLNDFVNWITNQKFFDNTTIVIVGDHCNMSRTLFGNEINKKTGYYEGTKRKIYNVFINSFVKPVQEKNRLFSTLDFFPTILASLGVKISGDRLGLGTNLFSEKRTYLEQYGYPFMYNELRKKSYFYNKKLLY